MRFLLVASVIYAYCSASIPERNLEDSLTYYEYDFGKVIRTDKIVSNSLNSIRLAVDRMDPIIKNMTKTVRSIRVLSVPDLLQYTEDIRFLGSYIHGHIENINRYCPHASSKLEVLFEAIDYLNTVCDNLTAVVGNIDFYISDEELLKKGLNNYILDIALVGRFFFDSCDKIMTPLTFLDVRNIELRNYATRFPELAKLVINDTLNSEIDVETFVYDSEEVYTLAKLMLNVTERIKLASDNLLVGNETIENKTLSSTKKFSGYKMLQSNIIFLISRGVSAFMKITRQKYLSDNATKVSNAVLLEDEDEYYSKNESDIQVDKSVCDYQKLPVELNTTIMNMLRDNVRIYNLSWSIDVTLNRIRRHKPTTKELSRLIKRDAIRVKKLLRDIMYKAKYLISVMKTCYPEVNSTRQEKECLYYCSDEIKPVCGIDRNLGYTVFLNKCMLFGHNTCQGTRYIVFDIELCMTILIKNPHLFRTVVGQTNDSNEDMNTTMDALGF